MRYRVHFVVRFEREIEAKDDLAARELAEGIANISGRVKQQVLPGREILSCHWNHMERLEAENAD